MKILNIEKMNKLSNDTKAFLFIAGIAFSVMAATCLICAAVIFVLT
jgi:hypothetical protein